MTQQPSALDVKMVRTAQAHTSAAALSDELEAMRGLHDLGERLLGIEDLSDALGEVLDAAIALFRADKGTVQVHDPELGVLRYAASRGFDPVALASVPPIDRDFHSTCARAIRTGERVVAADIPTDPQWADHASTAAALHYKAAMSSPAKTRRNELQGVLTVHFFEPHAPTDSEIRWLDLFAGLAAHLIESARAQAALRESDERFRQFAQASSGAIWIRNADTLAMEYVSPAIEKVYGLDAGGFLGDISRWAALIVPEDRAGALEHIERARHGESVVHEFRIQRPSDRAFRWIRNTDFPLRDANGRIQRFGGIAEDVSDVKLAIEHQAVLVAELQHRVRNIMAVIRSIALRTAENAESVQDYQKLLVGRVLTLSRVQALLTRNINAGVSIGTIVRNELEAVSQREWQFETTGPEVVLAPKAAEVLALAVHELTTNAIKYGALSTSTGVVKVAWSVESRNEGAWLVFDWREFGGPLPQPHAARRRGFGSELIESRVPYELGGRGELDIVETGVACHLEFPLAQGASILETNAPRRKTVIGGSIDMTGQANLVDHCILVAEDDFYLASDTVRALRGANARVAGPYPTTEAALQGLADGDITGAIVDINLGEGASFALARTLKDRNIPFVFITGYDEGIPRELGDVPRLLKPVQIRDMVNVLAHALGVET